MTAIDLARHLARQDLSESTVMSVPLREARASMIPFRVAEGFVAASTKLLTAPDENLKLTHSESDRVAGFGLSLAPSDMSGEWNTCRYATKGCRAACLATSGKGAFGSVQRGRVWKTKWLAAEPAHFLRVLVEEINAIKVDAWQDAGWTVSFRANVLSDLPLLDALAPWILARILARGIHAYDYTKWPTSKRPGVAGYTLCQSAHERTTAAQIAAAPHPVVVVDVKRGHALPLCYQNRPVVDGDRSDARFLDPAGSVVLLRFKAVTTTDRAAAVASGFVKTITEGVAA